MFNRVVKRFTVNNLVTRRALSTEATQHERALFSRINANPCFDTVASNYPIAQVTALNNGVRAASEYVPGEMATVGVFIDTGSRYENEKNNGVAHFLEHMLFKGTSNRTRVQLEKEIENIGGQLNAYTSREQTVFYARVFKKDVNQALDILSDILTNSTISPAAVESERSVILREMEDIESNMQEVIFDRLHQTAYRGSSLARTILGPQENIMSITKQDIDAYIKSHYVGPRMVVAGAGIENHEEFSAQVNKYFSKVPNKAEVEAYMEPAHYVGSEIRIRDDDMPFAHIAYGFETAGWKDPDHFPLMVLQMMLGSFSTGQSSAIYSSSEIVRTLAQNEIAESITPFNTVYSDTGLFGLYLVADCFSLDNAMEEVSTGLTRFTYNVSPVALQEAKNKLNLSLSHQYEGSTAVCEELGRQMINYGRRMHPIEVRNRIDSVTVDDIARVAQRFFHDEDFVMAAAGPIWELPDYNMLRFNTYSRLV